MQYMGLAEAEIITIAGDHVVATQQQPKPDQIQILHQV